MNELRHVSEEDLELYIIGAHDQVPVEEIEEHLASCRRCAYEAERQAFLEMQLTDVARAATFCPACDRIVSAKRCGHCGAALNPGGYRVERVIVQTAHGRLYLATDTDGSRVALKELVFTQVPTMATVEAFEKEGRLLQQLEHPSIPKFVASFCEGEGVETRLYLAQEYVAGKSLLARLADHRFTEEEVVDIAHQTLEVLAYLQSLSPQIFHRDVKPANLIRRTDGRIMLVDFGSARELGPTTGATLAGTFGYMPTEQMVGIVDATSDLYALGASMCHLLSRTPPWKVFEVGLGKSRMNISPGLRGFLGKLTAQRPAARFQTAREALDSLYRADKREPNKIAMGIGIAAVVLTAGVAVGVVRHSANHVPVPVHVPAARVQPAPKVQPAPQVQAAPQVQPAPEEPRIAPSREQLTRAKDLHDRAWRSWTQGDVSRAVELLHECVKLANLPKCHRTLGSVYAQVGDKQKSLSHYRRYLGLEPGATDAARVREIISEAEREQ